VLRRFQKGIFIAEQVSRDRKGRRKEERGQGELRGFSPAPLLSCSR
jgi:hypothetical protein